ncbi:MAG TPA: sugar phosphate isomerase/epimerase [Opitutaceae bacterium]|nr:sugar phosphate isomerase/epimerase [Opitutaceae bacterium]
MKTSLRLGLFSVLATVSACAADFRESVGLQLYSLQAHFKVKGPAETLDLIKSFGFTDVETWGGTGLKPDQLAKELKTRGINPVSAHVGYGDFEKDVTAVIADAKMLGVKYVIVPILGGRDLKDEDAHKIAANFNTWGAALKAAGLNFGFHTHGAEFRASAAGNGETLFDIIMRETKPDLVSYEMDVLWTFQAGQDPVKLLNKYSNRWFALHLKDMRKGGPIGFDENGRNKPLLASDKVALGTGQIDWPAVLAAAKKAGVKYYFVEDETPNPLETIPVTLAYLRGLKL